MSARTSAILKTARRTPLRVTMARHGLGEPSQRVLEAMLWFLLLRGADECSTLEAAVVLRRARCGVVSISGGAAALAEALAEKLQRDGGELRLGTAVDHFLWEGHRITGVVTVSGETIRARVLVADVPPEVLAGSLLPRRHRWGRRNALAGPWHPSQLLQAMVLAIPEALMPSELSGHCFIVREPRRPAREENVVFVRSPPGQDDQPGVNALRHVTVWRFVGAERHEEASAEGELLDVLDEIVPGVGDALAFRRLLKSTDLESAWGWPPGSAWRSADTQDWLGQRGLPHRLGWPGLLAVGGWTYPGRLVADVVDGARRVVDLITQST